MKKNIWKIAIVSAGVCLAADNLTPLDVKGGLWETTSTTERSGMPPIPPEQLAKMPPEARARILAMSAPATQTKQSCLTAEDVASFGMNREKTCNMTVITSTGRKQEFKFDCDSQGSKNSGTMKIEAPDSTHVNSELRISIEGRGRVMTTKVNTSAKWLGASCGNVKPDSKK